ncbi:MAG: arginine--tRNA ligase [Thaumarchaeota archaeon]|mgnify:FL=1|nr:arginine--tRNA ligase [Nitrososphaerota archaeon]MBT3743535.1 arginine--tRNA ligase [Nitrososphaerota archaeon]MBT4057863.1 arginine--tRNA ligase [Nitrososphaerota archaeon]MBT4675523.1 arginine--tRNA ligase [Nitrososphaerota archaeon]MBT5238596.1 arginine--tRNA ligase [Nitrososphaerota archaeon]
MVFLKLLENIRNKTTEILDAKNYGPVKFSVESAKPGFGDITCNVPFLLSKQLKKSPQEISAELSKMYNFDDMPQIKNVESHASGYLNFSIDYTKFNDLVISLSLQENYGALEFGNNEKIVVEHTSVNPNKALHVGHIRNIILGDVVSKILKKANYDVRVLNYVDDSGLQVADIIVGFTELGFSQESPNNEKFDHYCGDTVYVKTTEKYETDKELEKKRHEILKQIEDSSSEISKIAQTITRKVLNEQLKTVWNLGVFYDCLNFESQIIHSKLWEQIFEKLKTDNQITYEDTGDNAGCWVIPAAGEDDKILVRSNGVATYIAKDIPYAAWKLGLIDDPFSYKIHSTQKNSQKLYETTLDGDNKLNFSGSKVITVIDNRQIRLQKIVSGLMTKFKEEGAYTHLGYESVTLSADTVKSLGLSTDGESMQMSGRKGLYVNADTVLEILTKRVYDESKSRNETLSESELQNIANIVAVGTIRYEMIKPDLDKIITFDLKNSLRLEGDTCSYIQYSYARASRILEKTDIKPNFDSGSELLSSEYETNLIKKIAMFDVHVNDSVNNLSPKVIAKYSYELAVTFSSFYEHVKVLASETPELLNARLCLIVSFQKTLKASLDLLGIDAPERM